MNLSKAFDSLNHDLLLAKLGAYGLDNHSEFYEMVPNQQALTLQINNHFGEWADISAGVPWILNEWMVLKKLMVCNPERRSFMLLGVDDPLQTSLVCGNQILEKTIQEKVLGVTLDNKLNFAPHLLSLKMPASLMH